MMFECLACHQRREKEQSHDKSGNWIYPEKGTYCKQRIKGLGHMWVAC